MPTAFQPCAVIPVFDHEHAIGRVVAALRQIQLPVLLVDDGSSEPCARVLDALSQQEGVELLRLPSNRGKGGAVVAGLLAVERYSYTHALQIDADGQHALGDVQRFLDEAAAYPKEIICGRPQFDASIPKSRFYGRYLTHALVWLHTLSFEIRDSMCGFRIYPLASTCDLVRRQHIGRRMDFDIEIIVRLYWRGLRMRWLRTPVTYPLDGVSHFRLGRDNVIIAACHARLFLGMVMRSPWLLARKVARAWQQPKGAKRNAHA